MSDGNYIPILKRSKEDNAWLQLGDVDKLKFDNPLLENYDTDYPGLTEMRLMRDHNYLMYAAEVLLGIENLPEQGVVLEELWARPFPMYIASRGFGKATKLDELVYLESGPVKMKDVKIGDKVYSRDGFLSTVIAIHPQGKKQVYRVKLQDGRAIDCCEDHLWVVLDKCSRGKLKEKTVSTKEMFSTKIKSRYYLPQCQPIQYSEKKLLIDPYILGCLLGDGASKDNFIPNEYKTGSIKQRLELVRGLMDTNGSINSDGAIKFTNVNKQLIDDLIDVLRSLGIRCQVPQGTPYYRVFINTTQPIFKLPRKLNRLKKNKTLAEDYVGIESIEKLDEFVEMQCITVDSPDHTYITTDYVVTHNSFLLAEYAMLKCALIPGTKIVVVGAAFRQSKVIFDYMVTIWENSPILRSICDSGSGPKTSPDRCLMQINNSWTMAVPLGDGSKIRGLRAHTILADEFACLEKDSIVETDSGFVRISDFNNVNSVVTGDSKLPLEKPDRFITTPLSDVYEIKLKNGYVIRCSENHKVKTNNGWKKPLQLSTNDYVEQSPKSSCKFGKNYVDKLYEKEAWLLGILVSEDCVTDESQICVTTTDISTCERLVNDYGFKFNVVEEYIDKRDWVCKKAYKLWVCDKPLRDKMLKWGLEYVTAHDKKIPHAILRSPESVIQSFLSGLFDGGGSCFLWADREAENRIGLAYYSVSERLCRDVQFLMYKLGFDGYIKNRESKISDNLQWFVRWNGKPAKIAATYLMVDRFKDTLKKCFISEEPKNYSQDISRNKWKVSIMNCGKTETQYRQVVSITKLDEQQHLYDYHLPVTHSFYAEGHRQHNSIPPDIFETVVRGFTAVSANPVDNVKAAAKRDFLKKRGLWTTHKEQLYGNKRSNQVIISGTADYDFKHYADYWKRYCKIIRSEGKPEKLREIFGDNDIPKHFNYKDFSVIRIPYELIPEGFMDDKQVAQAKATVHSGIYQKEYGACFTSDSDGFFRRSLIEKCVTNNPVEQPSGKIQFDALVEGNSSYEYVYGVDPASEKDNFSIVILEIREDHNRIVHCWTTNRKDFTKRRKAGLTQEGEFYGYCARKIRDLLKLFPSNNIAIDAQGGGIAVMEALHDPAKLFPGEKLLWPVIVHGKEQMSDDEVGEHVLHMIQFADATWTAQANHGLRKDLEDRFLLFPRFDGLSIAMAEEHDSRLRKITKDLDISLYDSLEDCMMEIEELKNELCTIVLTRTGTGVNSRDRWDTPELVMPNGRKGRMRKDRYSSLVMANMIARNLHRESAPVKFGVVGGLAKNLASQSKDYAKESIYAGAPAWLQNGAGNGIWMKIVRKK